MYGSMSSAWIGTKDDGWMDNSILPHPLYRHLILHISCGDVGKRMNWRKV